MPNCLYLTLSVCEFVILCIVTVLYFFNVLCNCVKVCNIVDWLLSFEWGVDGSRPCVTGSNCGIGCLDWGRGGLKVTEQDIIKDNKLNYVRQWGMC